MLIPKLLRSLTLFFSPDFKTIAFSIAVGMLFVVYKKEGKVPTPCSVYFITAGSFLYFTSPRVPLF